MLEQQPSGLSSLAQASDLLEISVQALEDNQQEGLQPTDMVSLIQLLSLAADIPSQPSAAATSHSQDSIQELSQHFISVADSIINEENALKWQAIREVALIPVLPIMCKTVFLYVVLLNILTWQFIIKLDFHKVSIVLFRALNKPQMLLKTFSARSNFRFKDLNRSRTQDL